MNSSSAGGCGGRAPPAHGAAVIYSTWTPIRNRGGRKRFRGAERLGCPPRGKRSRGETPMKDLSGKVAVITGAGSGFGREFARIGAREGMKLALADVQQDALEAAVAEARAAGAETLGLRVDVSKPEEVEELA